MSEKSWFAIDIVIAADAAEAAEFALNELDALGTEIDSLRKPKDQPLRVSGYFEELPDRTKINEVVDRAVLIYGFASDVIKSVETRTVEQTDWLAEWKKHWKPTTIGKFIITPPWETPEKSAKIVISIEPNMAFGTGTHATTQLCLRAIGENYRQGQSALDVGTGTGILAIAVAKLAEQFTEDTDKGIGKSGVDIFACDTDKDSVKIARENAVLNNVGGQIEFSEDPIDENSPKFNLVIANLTIDVIVPLLGLLIEKTGQTLLLSGILVEQKNEIADALKRSQISHYEFETLGEWLSVLIKIS